MRLRAPLAFGVIAAGSVLLAGCSSATADEAADDVIRIATLPVTDNAMDETPVDAIAELLAEATGREVVVTDVPNYSAVIEAVRAGHEDIGLMSGFPSALAVATGEVDALVAWPGDDEPVSTCLVLDESPIRGLDDIAPDTVIAFADPASSSGFFMPTHLLYEAGLVAGEGFEQLFTGGHDRSFMALEEGQADVVCTSTIFPTMPGTDMFPFAEGETRSIGESISMPVSMSLLGNQHMSDEKRQAIIEAIPQVFSAENADRLDVYAEIIGADAAIVEPDRELFQPFVDIAAVADVDISDLG